MKLRPLKKSLRTLRSSKTEQVICTLLKLSDSTLIKNVLSAKRLSHHHQNFSTGDLFIALSGKNSQGYKHIPKIITKASAVILSPIDYKKLLSEHSKISTANRKKIVLVPNPTAIAPKLAALFYAHPSQTLEITAITGTNGKTSLTWILEQLTCALGYSAGVLGTISIHFTSALGKTYPILKNSINTTPHPIDTQHALAVMRENGVKYVFIEASSHGLKENRLAGIHLKSAIFTNLSHDHLDYHKSFEDYLTSKLIILEHLKNSCHTDKRFLTSLEMIKSFKLEKRLKPYKFTGIQLGLIQPYLSQQTTLPSLWRSFNQLFISKNQSNSPAFQPLIGKKNQQLYGFSLLPAENNSNTRFLSELCLKQLSFNPKKPNSSNFSTYTLLKTHTNLIGNMYGENLAFALLELAGLLKCQSLKKFREILEILSPTLETLHINGRMQTIIPKNPAVLIDFAHTPAALEAALTALKPYTGSFYTKSIKTPKKASSSSSQSSYINHSLLPKKLYVLFGCGGNRDPKKRPQMGKIAYKLSDGIFLSSDNPRHENPITIIHDIEKGILKLKHSSDTKPVAIIPNRRKAIRHAIKTIEAHAILLIAGKGHEQYESIGYSKKPLDEIAIIRSAYAEREKNNKKDKKRD